MSRALSICLLSLFLTLQVACQKDPSSTFEAGQVATSTDDSADNTTDDTTEGLGPPEDAVDDVEDHVHNDPSVGPIESLGCIKANSRQLAVVDDGNEKKSEFLDRCVQQTGSPFWCQQLVRPNVNSAATFGCTYGPTQVHQLIHPDQRTWQYPITAVKILQDLIRKGIRPCEIYNWWRPEPYNKNVGGAAGRHPYGTSIDVRFCSRADANRAFTELCKMRKAKRLRALGDYGSASLHLGIGDHADNTWGKSCP